MTKRYGYESRYDKTIKLDFWLVVARGLNGSDRPGIRINADHPRLERNERAINLKIDLPIALFEAPSLTARIAIDQPSQAVTIDATAIAEAVRQCIGMDVEIAVASPEGGQ
jgi:hypothetical protein